MKNILFVSLFVIISHQGYSQNTFPASGNVGIGTAASHILTIKGSASSEEEIVNITNMVDQDLKIRLSAPGAAIKRTIIATGTANRLSFGVGNSLNEHLTIIGGGNVGVGTTLPDSKLETAGKLSTGLRLNGTTSDYEALAVYNTPSGNISSGNAAVIQFYNNANNLNGVKGASIKSISSNGFFGWESDLFFRTTKNNSYTTQTIIDAMVIKGGSGNVGIGTSNPGSFKLAVDGKVWAKEVQVALTNPGPDYVFEKDYVLPSLESVKSYIDQNKHLPEVPSAKEMEANGINLSEMNMLLLKKIEEMTLYMLEQEKRIQKLESPIKQK